MPDNPQPFLVDDPMWFYMSFVKYPYLNNANSHHRKHFYAESHGKSSDVYSKFIC